MNSLQNYEEIEKLYNADQYEEVIKKAKSGIDFGDKSAEVYNYLGLSQSFRNNFNDAKASFQKAIELNPTFAQPHNNLGTVFNVQNMNEEAIREYKKAIEIDPQYASAYSGLFKALTDAGNIDLAITEITDQMKAITENKILADGHYYLAQLFIEKGQEQDAKKELELAIDLNPNDSTYHSDMGGIFFREKNYDMTINELSKAIDLSPQYASYYLNIALVFNKCGKNEEAVMFAKRYLELANPSTDGDGIRQAKNFLSYYPSTVSLSLDEYNKRRGQ